MRKRLLLILCVLGVTCGAASAQSTPTTLQSAATATGNGSTLNLNNAGGSAAATVSVANSAGTFTVIVEGSRDGGAYTTLTITNLADGTTATSITAAGKFSVLAPNLTIRARISACSSCVTTAIAWPTPGVISKSFSLSTAPGTVPIASGGTGATSKAAAFDALSPMTTSGDIIYGGASGTGTRLGKGSDGQVLQLASGLPSWVTISTGLTVDTTTVSGGTIGNIFFHKTGNVLGELTTTGSGTVVALGTSPTFTTDITAPLHIGGTGTGSSLTLKSTSGVGATDFIDFLVGSNGATRGGRFDTNGNLSIGLGTTTAPTRFVVGDTSSSTPRGLMSWQASDDTSSAHLHMRKTRGTFAAPTIVVTGDILGRLVFSGYDGASYLEMGSIRTVVTGTVASTRIPTQLIFSTATDAAPSVLTTALILGPDQSATFAGAVSGTGAMAITGGAGNMTITSGTGNSRTLTLRTTDSGGTAQNAITIGATQISTFLGSVVMPSLTITGVWIQNASNMRAASGQYWGFSSASDNSAISDVTLSRGGAGVLNIGTGTTTSNGALAAASETLSGATPVTLSNAGFTTCTALTTSSNVLTCTVSDRRVKQNFSPFSHGLDFIRKIQPQTYSFKKDTAYYDNDRTRLGLVAQEVDAAGLHDAVIPIGNGLLQIDYPAVTAAAIQAIKELDAKVARLEARIVELEKRH